VQIHNPRGRNSFCIVFMCSRNGMSSGHFLLIQTPDLQCKDVKKCYIKAVTFIIPSSCASDLQNLQNSLRLKVLTLHLGHETANEVNREWCWTHFQGTHEEICTESINRAYDSSRMITAFPQHFSIELHRTDRETCQHSLHITTFSSRNHFCHDLLCRL
jgi:hypothetical protein